MASRARGFTLIELLVVLIVFAIVATLGSQFVVTSIEAYNQAAERNKLVVRGRAAVERMHRQLRVALPHSVRVSANGQCVEFMQLVAGTNYQGLLPDENNGAAPVSSIATAPFVPGLGSARFAAVGALSAAEIYGAAANSPLAAIASLAGTPVSQINLSAAHRFKRNSINRRVYVVDTPERFCVAGNALLHYSGYGLTAAILGESNSGGGSTAVLAGDVVAPGPTFGLSPATETRSAIVSVQFGINRKGETVDFNQQIHIRNVP